MGATLASNPRRARAGDAAPGRRARKKSRTRREIFEAAMALFEAQGFEAVRIEQICKAADVARGTFFLHFPTKSALLHAWNRELARELALRLAEPRGSAVAEYRMLVDHVGQRWLRHADVLGAMLRDLLATPHAAEGEDALRALVEEIVRRGQERGEFRRNVSPRLAATLLLTTAAAVLAGAVFREGEASPEQIRNQLLHAVLHGLVSPKPRLKWQPAGDAARQERP
jgi:AcrR family transcriptional regulator